jgi:hypothetical protein
MNVSATVRDITVGGFLGGLVALLAALLVRAVTDAGINPFAIAAIGIAVGAGIAGARGAQRDLDEH